MTESLIGDAGDLIAADPTGHIRRTIRAVFGAIWATCGITDHDAIDHILEGL